MAKDSRIQICGSCNTKVLPTQEGCCPACEHEFESPLGTVLAEEKPADNRFGWIPLLVLAGMIALAARMERERKRRRHLKLVV